MSQTPDQLQDLVDTIAADAQAPVTLEDRDLNLVASSGHDDVIDEVRRVSILRRRSTSEVQELFAAFGIAQADGPLRVPGDPAAGRLPRWCVPLRWRRVTYGYLWLLDPDGAVTAEGLAGLGEVLDQVAAALALRARRSDRTSWAVGELLSPDQGARARAAAELRRDGLLPPDTALVVVALAPRDSSPIGPVNAWGLPPAVLTAAVGQRTALVLPEGAKGVDVAAAAARSLLAQHPAGVAAGVSGPVAALEGATGWRQAGVALRAALEQAPAEAGAVTVRAWPGLGVLRLLALAERDVLVGTVADDGARRLLEADVELLRTARTYLDLAGSAQRASAALGIHRQTLYHRLRRIREVSGHDLDDGRDRLALHLALVLAGR